MNDETSKLKLFDNLVCAYHVAETTIKAWGEDAQLNKTIEECAELIVALQHSKSRTLDVRTVASEIADVLVMVMCAARVIGVDLVTDEMTKKLMRLKTRLETVKPQVDLEDKYNKALQQSTEMESRYFKELARAEDLQRQLLAMQEALPEIDSDDEKNVDKLLVRQRGGAKKRKITKRK
jgi:NTP pyrophosphatase (non-canonical NTP hydrolase)